MRLICSLKFQVKFKGEGIVFVKVGTSGVNKLKIVWTKKKKKKKKKNRLD